MRYYIDQTQSFLPYYEHISRNKLTHSNCDSYLKKKSILRNATETLPVKSNSNSHGLCSM